MQSTSAVVKTPEDNLKRKRSQIKSIDLCTSESILDKNENIITPMMLKKTSRINKKLSGL